MTAPPAPVPAVDGGLALRSNPGMRALLGLPKIGARRAHAIAERFDTWDDLAGAATWKLVELLGKTLGPDTATAAQDGPTVADLPDGVTAVTRYDPGWPSGLDGLDDPPGVVWLRGTPPPPGLARVAVVGTRRPTGFGTAAAAHVAAAACEHGLAIVSGLALGVDTVAAEAASAAGRPSWAWVGQGVDTLVEGARADLARRIVAEGGGILAEVPPGTDGAPHHLIRRNRLQVATSHGVAIAQARLPTRDTASGTMHAARYAVVLGVPLGVCQPKGRWAEDPESAGNLALLDPAGTDPANVHATKAAEVEKIAARRPVADTPLDRDTIPGWLDSLLPDPW